MIKTVKYLLLLTLAVISISAVSPDWGFYGHRKINRMAVFTLPQELIGFYKSNIEYVTEHAVDPDKRRYATKHEAVRHYIDIDHWGTAPFENVPRKLHEVFLKFSEFKVVNTALDTQSYQLNACHDDIELKWKALSHDCTQSATLFYEHIFDQYYEEEITCDCEAFMSFVDVDDREKLKDCQSIVIIDHFREYGILPYWLPQIYKSLSKAFERKDQNRILRLSAEIGHYIGDAHVPLHTTENYNGQLTDQIGIHGFWESRLPELFADEQYDFFVGQAEYIKDPHAYFWKVVMDSHDELDEVLAFEKSLSQEFPEDQQFCFDDRNEITIRTQCEGYASAYHTAMDGMVEERMKAAIHAIGSAWYSAWVDAGQPDLTTGEIALDAEEAEKLKLLEKQFKAGGIKGRDHGGE